MAALLCIVGRLRTATATVFASSPRNPLVIGFVTAYGVRSTIPKVTTLSDQLHPDRFSEMSGTMAAKRACTLVARHRGDTPRNSP